jgi:hypothetical protein
VKRHFPAITAAVGSPTQGRTAYWGMSKPNDLRASHEKAARWGWQDRFIEPAIGGCAKRVIHGRVVEHPQLLDESSYWRVEGEIWFLPISHPRTPTVPGQNVIS